MPQEILLTKGGYERLTAELESLEQRLYKDIPERLKEAKEYGGDIRENKEYVYLVEERDFMEQEARRLRELLSNARIISEEEIGPDQVGIGTQVILEDLETKETQTYTLVSPPEIDLLANRIGIDSPVGVALLGQGAGRTITVRVPAGKIRYRLLGIERG